MSQKTKRPAMKFSKPKITGGRPKIQKNRLTQHERTVIDHADKLDMSVIAYIKRFSVIDTPHFYAR